MHELDMGHILTNIFELDDDPNEAVYQALAREGITRVRDLIQLDFSDYESFQWNDKGENGTDNIKPLLKHHIRLLQGFKHYIRYQNAIGQPIVNDDWINGVEYESFWDFIQNSPYNGLNPPPLPQLPIPTAGSHTGSSTAHKKDNKVHDWRKGMWHDPAAFTDLKRDEDFRAWNNDTILQAAAQGVENALDASYTPDPSDQDEQDLFTEQQK